MRRVSIYCRCLLSLFVPRVVVVLLPGIAAWLLLGLSRNPHRLVCMLVALFGRGSACAA